MIRLMQQGWFSGKRIYFWKSDFVNFRSKFCSCFVFNIQRSENSGYSSSVKNFFLFRSLIYKHILFDRMLNILFEIFDLDLWQFPPSEIYLYLCAKHLVKGTVINQDLSLHPYGSFPFHKLYNDYSVAYRKALKVSPLLDILGIPASLAALFVVWAYICVGWYLNKVSAVDFVLKILCWCIIRISRKNEYIKCKSFMFFWESVQNRCVYS